MIARLSLRPAAVFAALALSAALVAVTGGSPAAALRALYQGSLADAAAWSATLLYAAPLLLVASGACVSARSGLFNIGQEGQVLVGALAGAWAGLSALMHRWRGVDVVVSTLLMTFVAQQVVAFAVTTPWLLWESRVGDAAVSAQSNKQPATARPAGGAAVRRIACGRRVPGRDGRATVPCGRCEGVAGAGFRRGGEGARCWRALIRSCRAGCGSPRRSHSRRAASTWPSAPAR